MRKYHILGIALCFCLALTFAAQPASAAVIDWIYTWYAGGGTSAFNPDTLEVWSVGSITGDSLVKVEERYTTDTEEFAYDISNIRDDHSTYAITGLRVYNESGAVASSLTGGPAGTGWSVATSPDYWTWSTPNFIEGADGGGALGNFKVTINAPRGLVQGVVYFSDVDGSPPASNPTASGLVSGPVPEPTSMLLLGVGLIGLAGRVRKRFKA